MKNSISSFIKICNEIGTNIAWAQGTGGNVSLKISDYEMLIKASGVSISQISPTYGLVKVDYTKVASFYSEKGITEEKASFQLQNSKLDNTIFRPSMETGFHALLDRVVIHTHPSSLNLFSCMADGHRKLRDIVKENFLWIPYKNPGHELTLAIRNSLNRNTKENILVLENHGLIICSETPEKALELQKNFMSKIDSFLVSKNLPFFSPEKLVPYEKGFLNKNKYIPKFLKINTNKYMFPDAAVFCKKIFENITNEIIIIDDKHIFYSMEKQKAEKIDSVLNLHIYLSLNIPKLGNIKFLEEKNINKILNMETEKYRQNILK